MSDLTNRLRDCPTFEFTTGIDEVVMPVTLRDEAADALDAAEAELASMKARGGDIARAGCPNCTDGDPMPVLCCVRCGTTFRDADR